MKITRGFQTVDTHTGGEPTRTVFGGLPVIPGATMQEKYIYAQSNLDGIRKMLCLEPRGNDVMSGAILTQPCNPKADIGVLYFETGGWLPMCGHDTIGVSTAIIELGLVPVCEPVTKLVLDTASGLVSVTAQVQDGQVKRVSFLNAPSFVMQQDAVIETAEFGRVTFDVAFGGNVYAILPAASVGLELLPQNAGEIVSVGVHLRDEINRQLTICHPELSFVNSVTHIEFYGPSPNPDVSCRNAVIITSAAIDRSPCGTGTSAKLAVLHAKGKLGLNEPFVHESLIGSKFYCRIADTSSVAGIPAIIAEIGGQAFVTGMHTFFLSPDDPFPEGFSLN